MRKNLYLLLLFLGVFQVFSQGNTVSEKFKVGFQDISINPELVIDTKGNYYFFYIKDNKLIVETKKRSANDFEPLKNFQTNLPGKVTKIINHNFRGENKLISIVVDNYGEYLNYLLTINSKGISFIAEPLSISKSNHVKAIVIDNKNFIVTYIKNGELHYSLYNNNVVTFSNNVGLKVNNYTLKEYYFSDNPFICGYFSDYNGIHYLYLENNSLEVFNLDSIKNYNKEDVRFNIIDNSKVNLVLTSKVMVNGKVELNSITYNVELKPTSNIDLLKTVNNIEHIETKFDIDTFIKNTTYKTRDLHDYNFIDLFGNRYVVLVFKQDKKYNIKVYSSKSEQPILLNKNDMLVETYKKVGLGLLSINDVTSFNLPISFNLIKRELVLHDLNGFISKLDKNTILVKDNYYFVEVVK